MFFPPPKTGGLEPKKVRKGTTGGPSQLKRDPVSSDSPRGLHRRGGELAIVPPLGAVHGLWEMRTELGDASVGVWVGVGGCNHPPKKLVSRKPPNQSSQQIEGN